MNKELLIVIVITVVVTVFIGALVIAACGGIPVDTTPYVTGFAHCPDGGLIPVVVPVDCATTCPAEAY